MKPWQGRLVGCVLTMSVAAGLTSCTEPEPQPIPSPTPTVSAPTPSGSTSPTPSAEELDLRGAEQAVSQFWRVIDRLSADPESDLTSSLSSREGRWRLSGPETSIRTDMTASRPLGTLLFGKQLRSARKNEMSILSRRALM